MHRLSLLGTSAVLAASLLAAPGPAKAQTVNYIGADLAYTVNGSGTSTASGTSALNTALVGVTSTGNLNTVRNGIGNYPEDYGLTSPGGTAYGVRGHRRGDLRSEIPMPTGPNSGGSPVPLSRYRRRVLGISAR